MIQPAPLLYRRDKPAESFRRKLFLSYTVDEVTNLSALRRELFADAIGPACVIVFGKKKPLEGQTLLYICPKPLRDKQAGYRFVIEPQDVNEVTHHEAATEPIIWCALAIGGRRDFDLALRLSRLSTINNLKLKDALSLDWGLFQATEKKYSTAELSKDGGAGPLSRPTCPICGISLISTRSVFHPTCSWNLTQKLSLDGKTLVWTAGGL